MTPDVVVVGGDPGPFLAAVARFLAALQPPADPPPPVASPAVRKRKAAKALAELRKMGVKC